MALVSKKGSCHHHSKGFQVDKYPGPVAKAKQEQEQLQREDQSAAAIASGGKVKINIDECEDRHYQPIPLDPVAELQRTSFEISRRFSQFQNTLSRTKNFGRTSDPSVLDRNLDDLLEFIADDYTAFRFYTVGIVIDLPTKADIRAAFTFYATVVFNAFSQHFHYNDITVQEPGSKEAFFTANGGEYANVFNDIVNQADPQFQLTVSNWEIVWRKRNGKREMSRYYEFGDQLSRDVPPSGPVNIIFQRQYPGATPTPLATTAATAAANQAFIAAFKKAVTGARITMQK